MAPRFRIKEPAWIRRCGNLGGVTLRKIVSGGQTGVDRGALDAALVAGFPCGGWCPADRSAEDGEIAERYPLTPLPPESLGEPAVREVRVVADQYRARTLKNVQDSDGTVILYSGTLAGGTLVTQKLCVREEKPLIVVDSKKVTTLRAADVIAQFLEECEINVLNVAGPRASGWPQGYAFSLRVIGELIARAL
jgi:putative molybdenum carrier protein